MANRPLISAVGLKELVRDTRRSGPATNKALREGVRGALLLLVKDARPVTPYAEKRPGATEHRHLRDMTRVRFAGSRGAVVNPLPYANVIHWGGGLPSKDSTSPRPHGRTHIEPTLFLSKTAEEHADEYLAVIAANIDHALARTGWR